MTTRREIKISRFKKRAGLGLLRRSKQPLPNEILARDDA